MKEKVVFAMLIFTLVGCRDHGAPNSAATQEVATASANQGGGAIAVPTVTNCLASVDRTNPLPSLGVPMHVPCGLRSDRLYRTEAGIPRRQVTFEFVDPSPESALSAIDVSMSAGGFRLRAPTGGQGSLVRTYTKAGYGEVHVWANPNPNPSPKNPAAKGAIGVDFPAPAAN